MRDQQAKEAFLITKANSEVRSTLSEGPKSQTFTQPCLQKIGIHSYNTCLNEKGDVLNTLRTVERYYNTM